MSLAGERLDVGVAEVGAVVDRRAPALDRQLHTRAVAELVAVESQPESGGASRLQHRSALVGVERAGFAERVDPAPRSVRRRRACRYRRDRCSRRVGRRTRWADRWAPRNVDSAVCLRATSTERRLVVDVEPVARLDLDRRRSGSVRLVETAADESVEFVGRGAACRGGRRADAATVVRLARHPGGELVGPITGEHEMGVGVDEAGDDAGAIGIDAFVGDRARATDVRDRPVDDDDAGVLEDAERPAPDRRIVRDERADVVDHERARRGHLRLTSAHRSINSVMAACSSAATSISTWRPSLTICRAVDNDVGDIAGARREHRRFDRIRGREHPPCAPIRATRTPGRRAARPRSRRRRPTRDSGARVTVAMSSRSIAACTPRC